MGTSAAHSQVLRTSVGHFPLQEYRLRLGGREWSILHTGAILTRDDESRFLCSSTKRPPYGVALWPAALGLAHELESRASAFRGRRVLELGAGTGLPGIVAASLGARVLQTDRHELAMSVCKRNGARNELHTIEYGLADWTNWKDSGRYDWILGSDILYAARTHAHLSRIFESNLAPGGRVLISDPFRAVSIRLLEELEKDGWKIRVAKWNIGAEKEGRAIGVFDLSRPKLVQQRSEWPRVM